MRTTISISSADIAGEFTMFLFNVRTMTHIIHLNTRSHATHLAMDEFYTKLIELADRFAESAIGHFKAIKWPAAMADGIVPANEVEPILYMRQVKAGVEKATELVKEEDLKNIVAEVLELTTSTLYKIEQLS